MTYELWEMSTGNLIGAYATQQEALALIRRAIVAHGKTYVDTILLGVEDEKGRSKTIAKGQALAHLASAPAGGEAPETRPARSPTHDSDGNSEDKPGG